MLDTYDISASFTRMRILLDGLSPLVKELAIDFKSGEECILKLEYEDLQNHCTICFRLTHRASECPEKTLLETAPSPCTTSGLAKNNSENVVLAHDGTRKEVAIPHPCSKEDSSSFKRSSSPASPFSQ